MDVEKSLVHYTYSCSNAMFNFLKDEDIDKLISELKRIEDHAGSKDDYPRDKELWFKFGRHDTLATSIKELERDLMGHMNRQFTIERFKAITEDLDYDKELRVYFS